MNVNPWLKPVQCHRFRTIVGLALVLAPILSSADLLINELLPDPEGSDGGREFVELLNTGTESVDLAGTVLEFANGAVAAEWLVRWTGAGGESLPPGNRYLIVDRNWQGLATPDAQVTLALQNGPDAIRLRRQDTILDLVGYGPLTDPEMLETTAVAVTPGLSLARRPDGHDSDDNAADFVSADPTPGAVNFLPWELTVLGLGLEPPAASFPGQVVQVTVDLLNTGTETLTAGVLELWAGDHAQVAIWDVCPPDARRQVTWLMAAPPAGRRDLRLRFPAAGGRPELVCELGAFQVGPGDLVLGEVLAAPDLRQGEWAEVEAVGAGVVDLAGYRIRDADGDWRDLPDVLLVPGQRLVLAEDAPALAAWHEENLFHGWPACDAASHGLDCRELPGSWPSLNNTPPEGRDFADRLLLADSTGCVVDQVVLGPVAEVGGGPVAAGRSLERISVAALPHGTTNWAVCTAAAGGTPGCRNSVTHVGTSTDGLSVQPRVLDVAAGVTVVHLRFRLPEMGAGWQIRIFDLWGQRVRDLGGDELGPGPRDLLWDARDDRGRMVPDGGYIALLRMHDPDGFELAVQKVLLAVRTAEP